MTPEDLYVVDPAEFVAERDRLAKELRAAGQKDEATAVKQRRRPPVPVWALNRVARDHADGVRALADATDEAREALASGDGDAVREALATRRAAVRSVVRLATRVIEESGRSSATQEREVESTLLAVTESSDLLDALTRGELDEVKPSADDGGDDDLSAMFAVPPAAKGTTAKKGATKAKPIDEKRERRRIEQAEARIEQHAGDLEAAEAELADAEMALADATRVVEEAQARASAVEKTVATARAARDKAEAALARAKDALAELQ